jgi:hypothetical protein
MQAVYAEQYQKDSEKFDEFRKDETVNASLRFSMHNSGIKTNHDAWDAGFEKFLADHIELINSPRLG